MSNTTELSNDPVNNIQEPRLGLPFLSHKSDSNFASFRHNTSGTITRSASTCETCKSNDSGYSEVRLGSIDSKSRNHESNNSITDFISK